MHMMLLSLEDKHLHKHPARRGTHYENLQYRISLFFQQDAKVVVPRLIRTLCTRKSLLFRHLQFQNESIHLVKQVRYISLTFCSQDVVFSASKNNNRSTLDPLTHDTFLFSPSAEYTQFLTSTICCSKLFGDKVTKE